MAKDVSAVDRYWAEPYLQHNPQVGSGVEALRAFAKDVVAAPGFKAERVRVLADGDLVATHGRYTGIGATPLVAFDIFRVEGGKIVEHWDGLQPDAAPNPSGHTMLDGPADIRDQDRTEDNRKVVTDFVNAILIRGEASKLTTFIGATYTQHNAQIADNLDGLGAFLNGLKEKGISFRYTHLHKVLAEGNFVLTQSEGEIGGTKNAFYDLFRVQDGKIVEHWDTIQEVPQTTKSGLPMF